MSIKVESITKTFEYYKKDIGLKSSIKNLFNRQTILKNAVNDVSFEIAEGEIVGFLGPNGAGKTTTLKMLSGILYPTSGTASVLGYTPWERKKEFKKKFSIVMGQKSQLWWDLPANESLNLNKYIYEIEDKDFNNSLEELTELLDVKDLLKVQVRRLSLGERMKMEIIASLIHRPRVLFLDEPTIGLDIISQKKMREFIRYYNLQNKTTVILTSHYMNDIEELCKRTIIINQGKLIYDGELCNVNGILGDKKLVKLQFGRLINKDEISKYGEIREFNDLNTVIAVDKCNLNSHSKAILDTFPVIDFSVEDIPIEEGIALFFKKKDDKNEEFII